MTNVLHTYAYYAALKKLCDAEIKKMKGAIEREFRERDVKIIDFSLLGDETLPVATVAPISGQLKMGCRTTYDLTGIPDIVEKKIRFDAAKKLAELDARAVQKKTPYISLSIYE